MRKIAGNNPKLDLVNVDVHTKFVQILSIPSQDIDGKQNSDNNQGAVTPSNFCEKWSVTIPFKLDLVNVGVQTNFGQILLICSQNIE